MKHYSKEELERYRHGELSVLGRINCSSHLKTCEQCAAQLKELQEEDLFVNELRDSIQTYEQIASESPKPCVRHSPSTVH